MGSVKDKLKQFSNQEKKSTDFYMRQIENIVKVFPINEIEKKRLRKIWLDLKKDNDTLKLL